jgi:hypothetical protein
VAADGQYGADHFVVGVVLGEQAQGCSGEVTAEVGQDLAFRRQLLDPGEGDLRHCRCGNDPVIGAMVDDTDRAIADEQGWAMSDPGQPLLGLIDQVGVDVNGHHVGSAQAVGQQGSVIAGARPDFQHPHPIVDIEGFEHAGHEAGHGGG